jgi:glycosyltransferase involved in cell wall biosynthesis
LIPPRCDVNRFDPRAVSGAEDIKNRHQAVNKKVVLFLGTLSIHKGLNFLLPAFARALKEVPDAALLLVGSGDQEKALRSLAEELGITEAVVFCGRRPYHEIPAYLSAADVFAFSSLDEGTPRAIMEAMAMQVPVVATRVGGIPELITHGVNGFLVPPADPEALGDALTLALRDPAARQAAARARELIVKNYSFEMGMQVYKGALYGLLDRPYPPA